MRVKEGTEAANELRKEKGWPGFRVVGWDKAPFYDLRTNNLTWSIRGLSDAGGGAIGYSINYSTRLLGRRGTMSVDLVVDPDQAAQAVPRLETLLATFSFVQGNRYSDFIAGDKVASYGLTALVAGGAGALAVKAGLFKKFWKLIVIVFVAIAGALRKLFAGIFGRKEETEVTNISPSE